MYDPEKEGDVEEILKLLQENDSDVNLSDGEEEDNSASTHKFPVRVGADIIGPNTCINDEVREDDNYEEQQITDKSKIKWRWRDFENILNIFQKSDDDFTGPLKNSSEYFYKYLGEDIFEDFAKYTNIYALQKNQNVKETNADEIKTLIGLHIAIGTFKLPKIRMYWDRSLAIHLFTENMSRDRFFQLRSNLHIVNNLELTSEDRMCKVRPLQLH